MRVCIVYDCLYPYTVGGAERWYRNLAERLAERGFEVTYVTRRQWPRGTDASVPGVDVRVVAPAMGLYTKGSRGTGRRRTLPPLVFGVGVLGHLLMRGGRYDVVHTGSMPYFPLLAAAAVRPLRRFRLYVDWIEVWTRRYWHDYVGRVAGEIGWRIQRRGARTRHRAFAFSRLHAERLHELGRRESVTVLDGLYSGEAATADTAEREPLAVFAGRHLPEKGVRAIVPAVALARKHTPQLRCEIYGDGPERQHVLRQIDEHDLDGAITAPGFVGADRIHEAIVRAMCLLLPSRREGYGLVVVEAAAAGTPTVVVAGPDNAATELVEDGTNGVVARSDEPGDFAEAIARVAAGGATLRASTRAWYDRNADRLSIQSSVDRVAAAYREP